jgi:hypothetical protein
MLQFADQIFIRLRICNLLTQFFSNLKLWKIRKNMSFLHVNKGLECSDKIFNKKFIKEGPKFASHVFAIRGLEQRRNLRLYDLWINHKKMRIYDLRICDLWI